MIFAMAMVTVWVQVTPPMERVTWSLVEDIELVDLACKSEFKLPRACLYRHISRCRIFSTRTEKQTSAREREDLLRICAGMFPEPVLLQRRFSDPNYYPNQGPP